MRLYIPESVVSGSPVHIRQGSTYNVARGQTVSRSLSHKPVYTSTIYVNATGCPNRSLFVESTIMSFAQFGKHSALSLSRAHRFILGVCSTPISRLASFRLCNVTGAFLVCNKSRRNILGPRLVSRPAGPTWNACRYTTPLID